MPGQPLSTVWDRCLPNTVNISKIDAYWLRGDMKKSEYVLYKTFDDLNSDLEKPIRKDFEGELRLGLTRKYPNYHTWIQFVSRYAHFNHPERNHFCSVAVTYHRKYGSDETIPEDEFFFAPNFESVTQYLGISMDSIRKAMKGRGYIPNYWLAKQNHRDYFSDISIVEYDPYTFYPLIVNYETTRLFKPLDVSLEEYWNKSVSNFRTR
jgi:hypothetical protein